MIKPENDFERWAVSQKMDIEHAIGLGYLSERTNISYKAWLGLDVWNKYGVDYYLSMVSARIVVSLM